MLTSLSKLLTKNYENVPLIRINFNLRKWRVQHEGSCICGVHPCLADDEILQEKMNEICDYIRETYDMEKIV